jgi:hypothetical protein
VPAALSVAVVLGEAIGLFAAQPPFGVPLGLVVAALGVGLIRTDSAASRAGGSSGVGFLAVNRSAGHDDNASITPAKGSTKAARCAQPGRGRRSGSSSATRRERRARGLGERCIFSRAPDFTKLITDAESNAHD